jgi:hypothetical protein
MENKGFNGFNMGGINQTGQINEGIYSLVDHATPHEFLTKISPVDGRSMTLVFSDEFETPGRTFYPVCRIKFPPLFPSDLALVAGSFTVHCSLSLAPTNRPPVFLIISSHLSPGTF